MALCVLDATLPVSQTLPQCDRSLSSPESKARSWEPTSRQVLGFNCINNLCSSPAKTLSLATVQFEKELSSKVTKTPERETHL